jgi:hypothetical protein
MDPKILKDKQISLHSFQRLLESLCPLKKIESLCHSNFVHMLTCNFIQMQICVISIEYVEIFKSLTCLFL